MVTVQGVFYKINFSIPTDDFLSVINEFDKEFLLGNLPLSFIFNHDSHHFISEVIAPQGLCFSFNMAYSHDMLDINLTSSDFHHQIIETGHGIPVIPEIPRNDSKYPYGLKVQSMFLEELLQSTIKKDIDGYQLYLHDSFELPSSSSVKYLVRGNRELDIKIIPQINFIDDSITHYDPVE